MIIQSLLRKRARFLEKLSMVVMLIGLFMACQSFVQALFTYSVLVMLIGLVAYNIFARIGPGRYKNGNQYFVQSRITIHNVPEMYGVGGLPGKIFSAKNFVSDGDRIGT